MNQPETCERKIILLLCLLAAAHVFIFAAAFPFFNVVDEQAHLDLVVRYSQADLPRTLGPPAAETVPFLAIYGTPEYLASQTGGNITPPPWTQPVAAVRAALLAKEAAYQGQFQNHEASQPPLYYFLAGAWWRLGKILGLDGGPLLYWLRFLNVPLVAALAWLGWFTARKIFPENIFICVAVPALIAFMPQTAFYAINNDILSPLAFGTAFALLLKSWNAEILSPWPAVATGLALAATFLVKISSLPLLAAAGVFLALKIFRLAQNKNLRPSILPLLLLFFCAALPMAAWLAWCKGNFGDFTGTAAKIQFLGWTHKPFMEWWHHPIFTPTGLWTFWSGLLATFWQGEFLWHRQPLSLPAVNLVYVVSSAVFIGIALMNLLPHSKNATAPQRQALGFGFGCFFAAVAFLGFLSIIYDFHGCFYPSRAHPYFTSGRLMLGALIPFLLLFVYGLDRTLEKFGAGAKFSALGGIILFLLVSETALDWRIFPSAYNWFHI